jgi:hypothetical protein
MDRDDDIPRTDQQIMAIMSDAPGTASQTPEAFYPVKRPAELAEQINDLWSKAGDDSVDKTLELGQLCACAVEMLGLDSDPKFRSSFIRQLKMGRNKFAQHVAIGRSYDRLKRFRPHLPRGGYSVMFVPTQWSDELLEKGVAEGVITPEASRQDLRRFGKLHGGSHSKKRKSSRRITVTVPEGFTEWSSLNEALTALESIRGIKVSGKESISDS